jgi:hypothetical protein
MLGLVSLRNPANRLDEQASPAAIDPSRNSTARKRTILSSQNGDKSRFHRIRKKNINRRAKTQALRLKLAAAASLAAVKAVPAV